MSILARLLDVLAGPLGIIMIFAGVTMVASYGWALIIVGGILLAGAMVDELLDVLAGR